MVCLRHSARSCSKRSFPAECTNNKKRRRWPKPPSSYCQQRLSLSEPKPCGELEGSTGDRGGRDPANAWIRNTRGEGDRVEAVAGILEAWMVEEVGGIHPKLQSPSFPAGYNPILNQREVDIGQVWTTDRVSLVVAEGIHWRRSVSKLVVPCVE